MLTGDTIAAVSSPPGRSLRALVRISGPDARSILAALRTDADASDFRRGVSSVRLEVGPSLELPALALTFPGPRSFTGEDIVELAVPGNPHLCERILARLFELGARAAEPGEFTARAFLNGRISIEQAEGVGLAIAARSAEQRDAAERLISGETGAAYRRLADELAGALALVEAGIDFTDEEDVVPIAPDNLLARIDAMRAQITELLGAASGREETESAPVAALIGPPNAGKSTLFNALLGRTRSVVSEEAGTTRDAVSERMDLEWEDGQPGRGVVLVDLAGLDAALSDRSAIDAASQDAARDVIARADVLIVCDPSGSFDIPVRATGDQTTIRVRTKADLPSAPRVQGGGDHVAVCALDGWNLGALKRAIGDAAQQARGGAALTVLPRHRRALEVGRSALDDARGVVALDAGSGSLSEPEIVAGALRAGLDAVGSIAGSVPPDDVIGRIFATFCIGK